MAKRKPRKSRRSPASPSTTDGQWIISKRDDLTWLIGPTCLGYFFLWIHVGLGLPGYLLWWAWTLTFDVPHFFATYFRTFLDREDFSERKPLLMKSLIWFAIPPILLIGGGVFESRAPFEGFVLFAYVYGWWHVFRQHYGFVSVYQKKYGEPSSRENLPDFWFIHIVMLGSYAYYILTNPSTLAYLNTSGLIDPQSSQVGLLRQTLYVAVTSTCLIYLGINFRTLFNGIFRGKPFNRCKFLYLLSAVPFYLLIFMYRPISTKIEFLATVPLVSVFHNVQYQAFVWFFVKNRCAKEKDYGAAVKRFGLAARIGKSWRRYVPLSIAVAVIYRYAEFFLEGSTFPLTIGPNALSQYSLLLDLTVRDFMMGIAWSVAVHHYYLDQKIWKINRDKKLGQDLNLKNRTAAS